MGVKLSIVIATHNRASLVIQCLDALAPQLTTDDLELIVVDSASDADQRQAVQSYVNDLSPRVRAPVDFIEENTPGVSRARNAGVARARSDWVATLDDDAVPGPGWLTGALEAIEQTPESVAIIQGRIDPRWPEGAEPAVGARWRRFLSLVEFDGSVDMTTDPVCAGANMLVRHSALDAIGGYNERFGRVGANLASGIDTALVAGIQGLPMHIHYSDRFPVEHVIHPDRLSLDWLQRRSQMDGRAEARILLAGNDRLRMIYQTAKSLIAISVFSLWRIIAPGNHDVLVRQQVNRGLLAELFSPAAHKRKSVVR